MSRKMFKVGISAVTGSLNRDIDISGVPIIGNQTILKDGSKWKVRDTILHDNFADRQEQEAHWIWDHGDILRDRSFFGLLVSLNEDASTRRMG